MGCHLVKTAVLLTAFNGGAHLPGLLDSLCAQSDPDFFVIMQDDGSTDGTPEILKNIASQDNRFVFGSEQGKHLGAAGNFLSLIRQADADCCLLCDQDDVWEPEKIAVLKQALQNLEKECGSGTPLLVHSDCSLIDESGEKTGDSFFHHQGWDPGAVTLPRLLVQNNVTGCTLIMNRTLRDLIAAHAVAKDLFMHDWFIALTAASFGRIAFVDQPLTRYRQHEGNVIGANLFNLVLVSGLSIALNPFTIPQGSLIAGHNASLVLDLPVMLFVMIFMTIPALIRGKLSRFQGIVLLLIYFAYCVLQFMI